MTNKKCPICGDSYRSGIEGWRNHIWTHKKKTIAWLAKKRVAARANVPKEGRVKVKEKGRGKSQKGARYCSLCGKEL
jgi:hypothetical protein